MNHRITIERMRGQTPQEFPAEKFVWELTVEELMSVVETLSNGDGIGISALGENIEDLTRQDPDWQEVHG